LTTPTNNRKDKRKKYGITENSDTEVRVYHTAE
jgi:hypothetical protein